MTKMLRLGGWSRTGMQLDNQGGDATKLGTEGDSVWEDRRSGIVKAKEQVMLLGQKQKGNPEQRQVESGGDKSRT